MRKQQLILTSAKAVVVRDDTVLLLGYNLDDGNVLFSTLPGGGVDLDEGLEEGLQRAMREKVNANVEVGKLLFVVESIAELRDSKHFPTLSYSYYYHCTLKSDSEPEQTPILGDEQVCLYWLPLSELSQVPLWPNLGRSIQIAFANGLPVAEPLVDDWQ